MEKICRKLEELCQQLWFALAVTIISLVLILGIASIVYINVKPYEYRGSVVIDLAQYQKLVQKYSDTQTLQATAYDAVADKILVTYNFNGKENTGEEYGIPPGVKLSLFSWFGR